MATMTISLPDQIAKKVDIEAHKQGFATRSEFVRSLLRKYFVDAGEKLVFKKFEPKPLDKVRAEFEKSGKYDKKFIDSLMRGIAQSSFYANKTSQ